MRLLLTVVRHPGNTAAPVPRWMLERESGLIGRGVDCDWVLPDPDLVVSGCHARIDYIGGRYHITDNSTNGLFVNSRDRLIGRGKTWALNDRDTLFVGNYEILVSIEGLDTASEDSRAPALDTPFRYPDPAPVTSTYASPFDAELPGNNFGDSNWPGSSAIPMPRRDLWSADDFGQKQEPARSPPALGVRAAPQGFNPFLSDDPAPKEPDAWPVAVAPEPLPSRPLPERIEPRTALVEASAIEETTRTSSAMFDAFLSGLGVPAARVAGTDRNEIIKAAGLALREFVSGTRALLATRAQVKSELRVERTYLKATANNPLKFSMNDDQALLALLGVDREGQASAAQSIQEGFRDLQEHELNLLAGARRALDSLMDKLDPDRITAAQGESGSIFSAVLPVARKAQYWDRFATEFKRLRDEAQDEAHGALARELAKAYDEQHKKS